MCTELSARFHKLTHASLQSDPVANDLSKCIAVDISPKSEGSSVPPTSLRKLKIIFCLCREDMAATEIRI